MNFFSSRQFDKRYKRLSISLKTRFIARKDIFEVDWRHSLLDDHALHDPYSGCRSFSVTGDVRVIYRMISPTDCLLLDIGTHHELYGN